MTEGSLQHRETALLETLLLGLDARESACSAKVPMLVYLADLLIQRAREELDAVRGPQHRSSGPSEGGALA